MGISSAAEWFLPVELMAIRIESGRSQRWIANAIGKHTNTVGYWERRERLPDAANVVAICRKLGVDAERTFFLEHVAEQLNTSGIVSDLHQRNIFIVERAEQYYGVLIKVLTRYIPGLLQIEDYHMGLLPDPMGDPTPKIAHWKRKERRIAAWEARTNARSTFIIDASAIADLDRLPSRSRDKQIQRLKEIDARPNCEVQVMQGPPLTPHGFELFLPGGAPNAGPSFVYVESLDQSRHIEDAESLALYHRVVDDLTPRVTPIGVFLE
ncbi:Scr1 family TA system antitoxin-like transcriptional regulator [Glycomyces xiaoerkulensis]|uniref:Scr1 family TA system antitoxin-like transcriptional regulator n=1 Tax=Glycomyces xiaoerkulensis TaxID=2038139 RepID=UPI000C264D90|nr:Scr1 family TA system antitoxin-like transcriptional regulator [Glycomyces xiaoerkulensis]